MIAVRPTVTVEKAFSSPSRLIYAYIRLMQTEYTVVASGWMTYVFRSRSSSADSGSEKPRVFRYVASRQSGWRE